MTLCASLRNGRNRARLLPANDAERSVIAVQAAAETLIGFSTGAGVPFTDTFRCS